MRIILYCQHVLGVGHFFRSLEICRSLAGHEVILVTGGPPVDAPLPPHVRNVCLPGLMMDPDFSRLYPTETGRSLDKTKVDRQRILFGLFQKERPELFVLELYPFGRKAFRFEIDPILSAIRSGELPTCRVICSLRDILVEKKDREKYESRVRDTLNRYFDAVLVHADPHLITLEETFASTVDIDIPIVYTGFVAQQPDPNSRIRFRKKLGIDKEALLILASAGGGNVGASLLKAVLDAFQRIKMNRALYLYVFTGPYMDDGQFNRLADRAGGNIRVARFTSDFLSYLSAADLSVSMAGYNTSMDILSTGVPALVWPFPQNREQLLRASRFEERGWLTCLKDRDLQPAILAERLSRILAEEKTGSRTIPDLNGAANTVRYLETEIKPMEQE